MVRLELWNGAGGNHEKKVLREFERLLPELTIDDHVWRGAFELAKRARTGGISVPATDLLIAACARRHQVALEYADSDFLLLAKLDQA
jgi:predicted nucleic acid-binding protein